MNLCNPTNHKDLTSLLEDKVRAEAKNTPATRKKQRIIKDTDFTITKEFLFWRHGLLCVCSSNMSSCVHWLGFWYETINKYYIDNHDKDTTIEYRWKFINRYIYYERWAYLWVHMNLDEAQKYFSKLPGLKEEGYSYVDAYKGVDMV